MIALKEKDWAIVKLVLDAKYRIETSEEYIQTIGMPGPPQDAVNVLHRYRDAILEHSDQNTQPKRVIVEGVALYPFVDKNNRFHTSKLYASLKRSGIGSMGRTIVFATLGLLASKSIPPPATAPSSPSPKPLNFSKRILNF